MHASTLRLTCHRINLSIVVRKPVEASWGALCGDKWAKTLNPTPRIVNFEAYPFKATNPRRGYQLDAPKRASEGSGVVVHERTARESIVGCCRI